MTVDGKATEYQYNSSQNSDQLVFTVPSDSTYTITFGSMEGYKSPDPVSFKAAAGITRALSYTYNSTLLTVKTVGLSKSTTVKYGSTTKTLSNNGTMLIPYGQTVTVTAPVVDGYTIDNQSIQFTTNTNTKTITFTYTEITAEVGIGLNTMNGFYKHKTLSEFKSAHPNITPDGVYVDDGEHTICVYLYDANNGNDVKFSSSRTSWMEETPYPGMSNYTKEQAMNDFSGPTVGYECYMKGADSYYEAFSHAFAPDGVKTGECYLPSYGEMYMLYNNIDKVNELLSQLGSYGGTPVVTANNTYWTCTGGTTSDTVWSIYMGNAISYERDLDTQLLVRPFVLVNNMWPS